MKPGIFYRIKIAGKFSIKSISAKTKRRRRFVSQVVAIDIVKARFQTTGIVSTTWESSEKNFTKSNFAMNCSRKAFNGPKKISDFNSAD